MKTEIGIDQLLDMKNSGQVRVTEWISMNEMLKVNVIYKQRPMTWRVLRATEMSVEQASPA